MMQQKFKELYKEHIKRDGADKLYEWLNRSDFYEAPASTRYHGSHPGGLVEHSVNVYNRLKHLVEVCWPGGEKPNGETIAIVSLLHDLCKANFYGIEMRNRKNEQGQWEKYPFYIVDDKLPLGHGEKSVIMLQNFMRLSMNEIYAIRFHMGDYSDQNTIKAFDICPLALLLHQADEQASTFDEEV